MELSVEQAFQRAVTAHKEGKLQDAERLYRAILQSQPTHPEANHNLGVIAVSVKKADAALPLFKTALEAKPKEQFWLSYIDALIIVNEFDNAKRVLEQAKQQGVDADRLIALEAQLSQLNSLFGHYQNGRFDDAEKLAESITTGFPKHPTAWKVLGAVFQRLGRISESVVAKEEAIKLAPNDAAAHNNLGNAFHELGRSDEALTSYNRALTLKPDYAEAYVNLGFAIKNLAFNSSNPQLYPQLIQLLNAGNFVRPKDVAKSILSLLKQDNQIKELLLNTNSTLSLEEATIIIKVLDKFPLLHHLMRVCPLPELQFEKLFRAVRCSILTNLNEIQISRELIYFLSTLAMHCFTNEYVYIESDEETHLVDNLQTKMSQTMARSEQPSAINILCLASYRPLHQYDWREKLNSFVDLAEVKKRLIDEPLLEKIIAKEIPVLEEISDDVSLQVKGQYEENPYPRWVKLGLPMKSQSIASFCDELKLQLHSEKIRNVMAPSILIAGCGTGQHSIRSASRISNCHVTAVDLSLSSLAYAQRKSNELCLTNIDYLQADILQLHQMGQKFHIIESSGVLHHMNDPMSGWRILVTLLKPGGLMAVGLYSELARRHIVEIREQITALGVGISESDIRRFRQSLAESHDENHQRLTASNDFFSLSTLRDLIFHVQEHRFTLLQIKDCLDELGLKFCGFENKEVISKCREAHGQEVDICDLVLWNEFEEKNPRSFAGMYQFWCQKQ